MKISLFFIAAIWLFLGCAETACTREYSILAVRVDFPYEDPDHETTSGRGTFETYPDLSRYYYPWDIPPHDKQYFENHLLALKHYWKSVSEEKVDISFEVWPPEPYGSYTMSQKFYKYGNGRTKEQTYEKLVGLLKEALETCKQKEKGDIDFSRFDTFMIIHAGIGSESSGALNDIPSAYITKEDILTYLGTSLKIDTVEIDNGIVVPEMFSSSGIGGLNGIMAQMFGFRLGLPSLSNNKDGLPAAGGWCLMDTGAMALGYKPPGSDYFRIRGFVPTHPCIWSKLELGWIEPLVVTADTTVDVAATHINNTLPRAIKIPVTGDEYLLIENRYAYAPRDSLAPAEYSDPDNSAGVWLKADHYDAYIPGSGILIWHVNDRIIRENRSEGAINDDPFRRGLDLLEADGRQDIGAYFGFGDPRAQYSEGHDDDTFKSNGVSTLSPTSNPHSGSMWGGNSGITVQVNSKPGEIMNVSITFTGNMKGFPLSIGEQGTMTAADLNGDGVDELISSGGDSTYVVISNGNIAGTFFNYAHPSAMYNEQSQKYNLVLNSDDVTVFGYRIMGMEGFDFTEISLWEIGMIATCYRWTDGIISITTIGSETHFLFDTQIECGDPYFRRSNVFVCQQDNPKVFNEISLPDTTTIMSIATAQDYIALSGKNNSLYLGYSGNKFLSAYPIEAYEIFDPIMADLDRDEVYETIVTTDREILIFQPDGTYETALLPEAPVSAPVAADIDMDGYPEIIQCTENGVHAFKYGGVPVAGFPFMLPPGDSEERITSPPVVADLNNDGELDIAFATSNMRMVSYDASGQLTPGFPLTLRGEVVHSPCIFRRAAPDSIAIAYITTDGMLMAHDLGTTFDDELYVWPMWKGGPQLNSALFNSNISSEVKQTAPFEAYCYPNPITGNTGTFRIVPGGPTDCTIIVYTADGLKVFEHHIPERDIIPGSPNEIKMNASDLASGLYVAKIETRQKTVYYKLGVLK